MRMIPDTAQPGLNSAVPRGWFLMSSGRTVTVFHEPLPEL